MLIMYSFLLGALLWLVTIYSVCVKHNNISQLIFKSTDRKQKMLSMNGVQSSKLHIKDSEALWQIKYTLLLSQEVRQ